MSVRQNHAQRVLSSLNQQRALGSFCDAMLNLGGGVVYLAHRNILACFSELFQQSTMSTTPCMEFCLQECPNDGLELLLNFVYTGELKLDPHNLDKVRYAAASLCVPEALDLCRRFKETSEDPKPVRRRRGRMPASDAGPRCAVREGNPAAATTTTTTTTRSGRVVKGLRRLVTDETVTTYITAPEKSSKRRPLPPTERGGGGGGDAVVEKRNPDRPTGVGEVAESQADVDDREVSPEAEEVEWDDDDDDDAGGAGGIAEDTDEEYVPAAEPGASPPASTSTARRRKSRCARARKENGDAAEEDAGKDSATCPVCDKSFKSKYYLKVHNRRHTGERPFGCLKCGKSYFRKENLLIHEIRDCSRTQLRTFSCRSCSSTFDGKDELLLHAASHTGDMPYKCSTCPEQFMYKKNLSSHMMKVHGHPKPHACSECPKTFLTRTELRVHEAARHRGEKPFVCEECGHRASSRNGLQMHIKAIHRNERPFVCTLCGHAFSQKNNLNMHLLVHSGERPFQCHLCGKTFRSQASLDKHNRTHTGERPYGCDVCERRFTEKGALVRHKGSKHEEGRPHCCSICDKTFKAKEQLRVHLRRHKGMRKFECVDCGYKFTRQAHLRRHVQIHKRTENYNPRQRKLRNVIVQDADRSPGGGGAAEASPVAGEADYDPGNGEEVREPTTPDSGCVVRLVMEAGDAATGEAASGQILGRVETQGSVSPQTFGSTIDMEGIAEKNT